MDALEKEQKSAMRFFRRFKASLSKDERRSLSPPKKSVVITKPRIPLVERATLVGREAKLTVPENESIKTTVTPASTSMYTVPNFS